MLIILKISVLLCFKVITIIKLHCDSDEIDAPMIGIKPK